MLLDVFAQRRETNGPDNRVARLVVLLPAFVLGLMFVVVLTSVARAADLTGIFIARYSDALVYFNLTQQASYLTGYFEMVSFDQTSPDGLRRTTYHVSGSVSGSRAILEVQGYSELTADLSGDGFTVSIPQRSGQIAESRFRRSSVTEVNRLVAEITANGNSMKYYANARADLIDAETRLSNDTGPNRTYILGRIIAAKKKLADAMAQKAVAGQKVVERQKEAAEAHRVADAAKAAAVTNEQQYAANELEYKANSADYAVNSASYEVNSAQWQIDYATSELKTAKASLVQMEARIVQLRQIIARDKRILHVP